MAQRALRKDAATDYHTMLVILRERISFLEQQLSDQSAKLNDLEDRLRVVSRWHITTEVLLGIGLLTMVSTVVLKLLKFSG